MTAEEYVSKSWALSVPILSEVGAERFLEALMGVLAEPENVLPNVLDAGVCANVRTADVLIDWCERA